MNVVMVEKTFYLQLIHDHVFLECLRAAGVDNWEGFDDACAAFAQQDLDQDFQRE